MVALGTALHNAGSPAHRLEDAMVRLSKRLDLEGQFFSTPTAIFATFGDDADRSTRLVRVEPGDVDLERLGHLDDLIERVLAGSVRPRDARAELANAGPTTGRWSRPVQAASFALVSAGAACFFGGGLGEIVAAALVGLVTGILALAAERWPETGRLLYPVAGLLAALVAAAFHTIVGPIATFVVTLAGLIVLLPGMTLTVAMTELATRHLVSGSARLAGALMIFVTIGFGVGLGRRIALSWTAAAPSAPSATLPAWSEWVALVVVSLAFVVQFRARPRDAGWLFLAGALAVFGGRAGAQLLGAELGAFLGAVLVGVAGNLVSRWRSRPAALIHLPGLMLLVPGSVGFRSLSSLLSHDTVSGLQAGFTMALVAIALVTGLLVANVIVPPRRTL